MPEMGLILRALCTKYIMVVQLASDLPLVNGKKLQFDGL